MDSINGGDSDKGVKLCLGLTEGDFWSRVRGANIVYKAQSLADMNFDDFEQVRNITEKIELAGGQPSDRWLAVVRAVSGYGQEEQTINNAVNVEFDSQGNILQQCNRLMNIAAVQTDGKVQLRWFYRAVNQTKKPARFLIYSDNGTGVIDFDNPTGSVEYTGRKFYSFTTEQLPGDEYIFCIKTAGADGSIDDIHGQIKICLNKQNPNGLRLTWEFK